MSRACVNVNELKEMGNLRQFDPPAGRLEPRGCRNAIERSTMDTYFIFFNHISLYFGGRTLLWRGRARVGNQFLPFYPTKLAIA